MRGLKDWAGGNGDRLPQDLFVITFSPIVLFVALAFGLACRIVGKDDAPNLV